MTLVTDPSHHLLEEKYRPSKLDDVIIPQPIKDGLKTQIKDGTVTSMIFVSPSPGSGKTTTAKAVAHELNTTPLVINASLENSIDEIRTKVIQYATTASMFSSGIKIVILDEADRLTKQAQDSLKGLMEQVSSNCSFILTTNYISRLEEPLISRCEVIEFTYSKEEQTKLAAKMCQRAFDILTEENITFDKKSVIEVVKKFSPDNRKILKVLQAYSKKHNNTIDVGILASMAGFDAETLITAMKAKKYDDVKTWCFNNYDRLGDDFYGSMFKTLQGCVVDQSIPQAVLTLNDYQRHHATVPDRFVHFLALCTELMMGVSFK